MDAGTSSLLESATLKTIHAQSFSRASSRASHVLTDLLSRYISLLATTCARYAEHSGRASVSVHDAFLALDELGLSMDELVEYAEGEAHELTRYNSVTTRRVEELAVLNDALTEGRKLDQDDAVPLVYAEMNTPAVTDDESDGSDDEVEKPEVHLNGDIPLVNGTGPRGTKRAASPLLPISPISNPSSPSRKRPRLQPGWDPPPHIPDFLPPFPTNILDTEVNALQSPQIKTEAEATLPPPASANGLERERLPTPPPQQLSTATSAADYLTPVPYNMSSLSTLPEGHLPDSNLRTVPTPASSALQLLPRKHEPPQIMPSILTAYHHVLTQKPPPEPSINPGRHRVALTMIDQSYTHPRWSAPDTLFANLSAARPRVVAPARAFAVFAGSAPGKEDKQLVIPSTLKTLVVDETILPLSHQPTSRMPDIARAILPYNVRTRATRLAPPPPLINPQNKEKFLYGSGMPAPWNADSATTDAGKSTKESKGADGEGRERDKAPNALEDAFLFATWDWETHDARLPVPSNKRGLAMVLDGIDGHRHGKAEGVINPRKSSRAGREG